MRCDEPSRPGRFGKTRPLRNKRRPGAFSFGTDVAFLPRGLAASEPAGDRDFMSDTQEPAETTSDGPLLDLTDAGVKKFIKQAKARGYVTMEELNKVLPSEEVTPDAIEDTLAMLSEMGVNVVEAEEDAEGSEGGEVATRDENTTVITSDKPAAYDRTDDPVRMYLREMGSVEL